MQSAQPVRLRTALAVAVLALAMQAAALAERQCELAKREKDPRTQESAAEIAVDVILRARESLGQGPLGDGEAFRPIGASNEDATPAASQREILSAEMRRMTRDDAAQSTPPNVAAGWTDPSADQTRRPGGRSLGREIETLRTAAFQMDQAAHRLECRRLYRRADQLRQLAGVLRADARALDQPSSAASASRGSRRE